MPELAISSDKVGFLIEKARQFDAKDIASDIDSGSNGADDDMIDVLEDNGEDPVAREIAGFISALSEDEQIEAAEGRNGRTARYLLGEPLLGDLLAEGLEEFGVDWSSERTTPVH